MEVAAGTVAFIGLPGQILQGCNYLCTFFSDTREAPKTVETIVNELQAVQASLSHFHRLFSGLRTYPHLIPENWDPAPALKLCEKATNQLKDFVEDFPELHPQEPSAAASSRLSSKDSAKKRWQGLKLAKNAEKLQRHISQLQNAKVQLQLCYATISSKVSLASHLSVDQQLEQISRSTASIPGDNARNQQAHTITLHSVQQVGSSMNETRNDLSDFRTEMSKQLDNLPSVVSGALSGMVEATVRKALAEHTEQVSGEAQSREAQSRPTAGRVEELDAHSSDEDDKGEQMPEDTVQPQSRPDHEPSSLTSGVAQMSLEPLVRKSPKRQRTTESSYNAWFGRILITTTITEQEDLSLAEHGKTYKLAAKRTMITLLPNLWFSSRGAFFQMGTCRPAGSHPKWDNRLRVFRTHPEGSPVDRVIHNGDYLEFRNMLDRREVTPFDQFLDYDHPDNRPLTLFELLTREISDYILESHQTQSLLKIAKLLADQGVDCGLGETMDYIQDIAEKVELKDTVAYELYNITLSHSEINPFESNVYFASNWVIRSFLYQEEWDLCGAQEIYETHYGKGSWTEMVIDRSDFREWKLMQADRWAREAYELRNSKDYCVAEFGSRFVEDDWPTLCWKKDKPPFWRSKEECEEAFGYRFVKYEWPQLYWEQELPPFWRSREDCEEAFGHWFVEFKWPQLYWEQELPPFWRSREECEEAFGYWFVTEEWPQLYWKQELPPFWRSREECEEAFGYRFVKYEWPQLYWEQELPPFWRSREECEEAFDYQFVEEEWPQLYWEQELPPFWRSREECEETFDYQFVEEKWPQLYWEQELPPFWRSREECEEAFGEYFVKYEWTRLLGRNCIDHFFGQGAWLSYTSLRGRNFTIWYRGKWLPKIIERWQSQDRARRYSRSYCISDFGVVFVKEHLPTLAEADGLSAEETKELTKDGPDMFCKPPQWPRKSEEDSWDYDEDNDPSTEGQSDGSQSSYDSRLRCYDDDGDDSGWETANESIGEEN